MYFFTVLTYPGGCPQSVTDLALRYCENKFSKYIIVTELGKSGRNLHVNIVYEIDDALAKHWSGNSRKNWIKCYFGLPTPTNSCAIVTQRSNTPENVVGGYLQKEANFTIVSNKGFDLDSCIAKAKSNLAKVVPKITLKNAHRFFNDTHIAMMYPKPLTEEAFYLLSQMIFYMGNDDFVPFMPKLHQIYIAYDVAYQGGNLNNYK